MKIEYNREYFGSDQFRITLDTDIQYQSFIMKKKIKVKLIKSLLKLKLIIIIQ